MGALMRVVGVFEGVRYLVFGVCEGFLGIAVLEINVVS